MGNVSPINHHTDVKQQAAQWLVRIDQGSLNTDEIEELTRWIKQSDFHHDFLLTLAKNWDDMAVLSELAEIFPYSTGVLHTSDREKKKTKASSGWGTGLLTRRLIPILASILIVLTFFDVWIKPDPTLHDFITDIGEQASYTLEDGTVITLNTNSQISVDYTGMQRKVSLLRGEANFEVAKNPDRPFIVFAGSGIVQAIGTAFNVRYLEKKVDVIVTEGRVKVVRKLIAQNVILNSIDHDLTTDQSKILSETDHVVKPANKEEVFLSSNQSVSFSENTEDLKPEIVKSQISQKLAWHTGGLIFQGETLEQALLEIGRYTEKELVIIDPSIRQIRIGGHYKTDDIDALLAILSLGFNIKVEQISDNKIQLSSL